MHRMIKRVISVVLMLSLAAAALIGCASKEGTNINVGILAGPTGIGASYLCEQAALSKTDNTYSFTVVAQATDLAAQLTSGALDIAALPTNVAANLYKKTNGAIELLAINTLGVLYILENGNTISTLADLRGKTIYTTGQGANPEYVLNYILSESGLVPGTDVTISFLDSAELATKMASGDITLCMLPCPASTGVLVKNKDVRIAVDVNDVWNELAGEDSKLTMGCLAVRKSFADDNADAIELFLKEYKESIDYVNENPADASVFVEKYGITGSAAVAEKAIPDCALVCITGADMKPAIENYYQVLFDADASSVGGVIPDDSFYYTK